MKEARGGGGETKLARKEQDREDIDMRWWTLWKVIDVLLMKEDKDDDGDEIREIHDKICVR